MSSSMLEQAIIDAKELKESAQKNAEEAIVEKYQSEIKEAVEKILEQDDLGLGGDVGGGMDMGGATGGGGKPVSANQPEAGKDQVSMVLEQLPFIQTTDDDEVIELNLSKLEESLNIVNEDEVDLLDEDEFTIDEDLLEEDFLDEEFELDEDMLEEEEEDLAEEVELTNQEAGAVLKRLVASDNATETSLEEMIAEVLEEMLGEGDDLEEVIHPSFSYDDELDEIIHPSYKDDEGEGDYMLDSLEEDEDLFEVEDLEEEAKPDYLDLDKDGNKEEPMKQAAKQADKKKKANESKKLQKENKTLIKEQTRMSSKVQLLEEKLDKYGTVIDQLKQKLDESNLVSAKLLYQNRVLDSASLNERQKNRIVEAIKDAGTVEEAKIIFETLQSTVETTGKSGRKRESLDEVVYRGSSAFMPLKEEKQKVSDPFVARMQALAGLK